MSERIGDHHSSENPVILWLSVIAVIVIVLLTIWWVIRPQPGDDIDNFGLSPSDSEVASPVVGNATIPAPALETPDIPQQPPVAQAAAETDTLTTASEPDVEPEPTSELSAPVAEPDPLPTLEDSDGDVRGYFSELSASTDYQLLWQTENLLQRWITVLNGAAKGDIIKGVIGFQPPKGAFPVKRIGANYYLSDASFRRYDDWVETIIAVSPQQVAAGFHRFRPLLEQAYGQMGYDPEQLDNMLITLLDRIIAAPVFPAGLELVSKSVNYTYANPDIEALPSLEKLLIRMGPNNTTVLQQYAANLRETLLNSN